MFKKTCVITGATAGIGKATAMELAHQGARLILVARNEAKAHRIKAQIIAQHKTASVDIFIADFASQRHIRQCAHDITANYQNIDVLVNNAGMVNMAYHETEDGIEQVWAVNHLAPFLFTLLMLPLLKAASAARIINVASNAHRRGTINFDDLGRKQRYSLMKSYSQSKLANILFTKELAVRLANSTITVNCMHPGFVRTDLGANVNKWVQKIVFVLARPFSISEQEAGEQLAHLCVVPELAGQTGKYFYQGKEKDPSKIANDMNLAKRLWQVSEEMTTDRSQIAR